MSDRCALCFEEAESFNRVGGLEVCDQCFHGDLASRMEQLRGWIVYISTCVRKVRVQHQTHIYYQTTCEVTLSTESALELRCARLDFFSKLFGRFLGRVTVGDPLFDEFVYLRTKKPAQLRSLLKNESFQSSVMDLLGELPRFRVEGEQISGFIESQDPPDTNLICREIAVFGAHIEADQAAKIDLSAATQS
ncbi:MAG: hypothetical protein VYD19_11230 [Myxococcota bacterium]|nr:hypothetical protein [Myxococcota bacterium]